MAIIVSPEGKSFRLETENTVYAFRVINGRYLKHDYYGEKKDFTVSEIHPVSFSPYVIGEERWVSLNDELAEFSFFGGGDFRNTALRLQGKNGDCCTSFFYTGYQLDKGRAAIPGLPCARPSAESETLAVTLEDDLNGCRLTLYYTVYPEYDVITRYFRLENNGTDAVRLEKAMCLQLDLPGHDFELLTLPGSYPFERSVQRQPLFQGNVQVASRRGMIGHQQNPFIALLETGAGEENGLVYGFNLVYSGSFLDEIGVDEKGNTRVTLGLGDECFRWLLEPGESFSSPEALSLCSPFGLGYMSRRMHAFVREMLAPAELAPHRPVVLNTWEACYFDIDQDRLVTMAAEAKKYGMDTLVMDDGWFGERHADNAGLGDWVENKRKFPDGLAAFGRRVVETGMNFGIWIEPEMVNPDSDLYRAHPDWCLKAVGRDASLSRGQLVLDFCNPAVLDYLKASFATVFEGVPLSYIKWDCNRNLSEVGSSYLPKERQTEAAYRYQLGVYELFRWFRETYPDVMIENCSGGGGRYDLAMMTFSHQIWTSDNTKAASRTRIQYGTSVAYPISQMSCHVSDPTHDEAVMRSLEMKFNVAVGGVLGYELHIVNVADPVKEEIARQIEKYHQLEDLIKYGDLYRLISPFEDADGVSAYYFTGSSSMNEEPGQRIYLSFLQNAAAATARECVLKIGVADEDARYRERFSGEEISGAQLRAGYTVSTTTTPENSHIWLFEKV